MKNIDNTPNCIGGRKHNLVPKRFRGNKRRSQCDECGLWTGWKTATEVKPKVKVKECYPGEAVTAAEVEQIKADDMLAEQVTSYEHWTVGDLKSECKERGITGYSKMKKDELMDVLAHDDLPVPV